MAEEYILSTGIDIGTSTTQLIFSRMIIKNTAGFGKIPQTEIVSKKIIYRSNIYFTPLLQNDYIDGIKVNEIIREEYKKAGITPDDLATGAVIITGESSRKKNAKQVVEALSNIAGDFVVATAGPDLESILAGKGSGAAELSKKYGKIIANLDIGGGTTNICYFKNGEVYDTACFDIGGRLVKVEDGKVTYIAEKIQYLIEQKKWDISLGKAVDTEEMKNLTSYLAVLLAQAVGLAERDDNLEVMRTNHLISVSEPVEIVTFSGGVAACMNLNCSDYEYQDIGVLLARAIKENHAFFNVQIEQSKETMRATVIGAGNYSMNISGSTIEYTEKDFPLKNIPIGRILMENADDIPEIEKNMEKVASYFQDTDENTQIAFAMKGLLSPTYPQIQEIANRFMNKFDQLFPKDVKVIIIMETDMGKALGQALKHYNKLKHSIICVDNIICNSSDYVDLGVPIANGSVIPVVVKTLVFQYKGGGSL